MDGGGRGADQSPAAGGDAVDVCQECIIDCSIEFNLYTFLCPFSLACPHTITSIIKTTDHPNPVTEDIAESGIRVAPSGTPSTSGPSTVIGPQRRRWAGMRGELPWSIQLILSSQLQSSETARLPGFGSLFKWNRCPLVVCLCICLLLPCRFSFLPLSPLLLR